jgi:hypothetical protein
MKNVKKKKIWCKQSWEKSIETIVLRRIYSCLFCLSCHVKISLTTRLLIMFLGGPNPWVVPLGTTSKWLKNQNQPNHFPRPFILNVFITINFFPPCLSIACINIWLVVYFGIKKLKL